MSFRRRGGASSRQLMPFGLDYADVDQQATGEKLYYPVPVNGAPTAMEKDCSYQLFHLAEQMKNGSLYTGTMSSLHQGKRHVGYLDGGVNDGIKRYSDRFRKKIKVGRAISDHPFNLEFFPEELHSVIVPKKKKDRKLLVRSYSHGKDSNVGELIRLSKEESKKQEIQQRLADVDGNAEDDDDADEAVDDDEEEDEEFEDEEDGDYNAEKYFSDGDDMGEEDDTNNDEAAF